MRVLLIGINYAPEQTGIAPYAAGLAEGLRGAGHEVRVITGVPHYPQWRNYTGFSGCVRDEVLNGISVRRVRHFIANGGTGLGRVFQELTFGLLSVLQSWRRADVVMTISPALVSSAFAVLKARILRIPVGIWVQDLYSSGARELGSSSASAGVLSVLESRILRLSGGVLVIHEHFKQAVAIGLKVKEEKITVSRNWTHLSSVVDHADVDRLRRRLFGDSRLVVIHTGNMGAKQGLENVVEAAREAQRQSVDIVFALVGDGSRREELVKLAEGVEKLVFVPQLGDEEYRTVLQAADVLLVNERPGLHEMALPSKLTSYFLQGKPVVAATEHDSTTAQEMARSGAGPVVEPGNPGALLQAIEQVGSNSLRHQLGENALEYCAAYLSADAAILRIEGWLQVLVDSSPQHG